MKIKAVRLYGKEDLRFEEFELRDIQDDEILAQVMTDSLCMSSYKAMLQGSGHRCIPDDIGRNPIIMGHELCARILRVGCKVKKDCKPGDIFAVQAKMFFGDEIKSPGYCYTTYGGNATNIIVPSEVIDGGYLLPFDGDAYFKASMAEPISCLISALRSSFHLAPNNKDHMMGLRPGGSMAILAGCGPMGLGAAEAAMALENRPARIVLTDIDEKRVARAQALLKGKNGVKLEILNTNGIGDLPGFLGAGRNQFDDILVMAPVPGVIEQADSLSGIDTCINFFAGPTRKDFYASINFYDVHYNYKHIIGTSGGDIDDMREALRLIEAGEIDVSVLISHIGGLNCAAETTKSLPRIPGAKKLIYCNADLPLTAIDEFAEKGKSDPFFADLRDICAQSNMLWCREAEEYLLEHAKPILED